MSDTESTHATTARTTRPTALGDLRFAGTIAAGLVAGTLGLGALAAPLVGWKDWPSGLTRDGANASVRLVPPQSKGSPGDARPDAVRVSSETQPNIVLAGTGPISGVIPAIGGGGGAGAPGETPAGGPNRGRESSATTNSGAGEFQGTQFGKPDMADDDGDGIANDVERQRNLDPSNPGDAGTPTGNGISVLSDIKIRSQFPDCDTNGNGFLDGDDDCDGDGVPNAIEERNGTDPTNPDSNGDGRPDGMEDNDGDGYPDGLPIPQPIQTPTDPVTPPAETQPEQPEQPAAPPAAPKTPTVPVDEPSTPETPTTPTEPETPAPEAPVEEPAPPAEAPVPETTEPAEEAPPAPPVTDPPAADPPAAEPPAAEPVAPEPASEPAPAPEPEPAPAEPAPAPEAEAPADPAATPAW